MVVVTVVVMLMVVMVVAMMVMVVMFMVDVVIRIVMMMWWWWLGGNSSSDVDDGGGGGGDGSDGGGDGSDGGDGGGDVDGGDDNDDNATNVQGNDREQTPTLMIIVAQVTVNEVAQLWKDTRLLQDHVPRGLVEDHLVEHVHDLQHHLVVFLFGCGKSKQTWSTFLKSFREECISEVVRIGSKIIFHLSKLWKSKFFILCDLIFLVRLQGKFDS